MNNTSLINTINQNKVLSSLSKNTPTERGLYLGRSKSCRWWNYVVQVSGEPPFLKCIVWERLTNVIQTSIDPSDIWFGPMIDENLPLET